MTPPRIVVRSMRWAVTGGNNFFFIRVLYPPKPHGTNYVVLRSTAVPVLQYQYGELVLLVVPNHATTQQAGLGINSSLLKAKIFCAMWGCYHQVNGLPHLLSTVYSIRTSDSVVSTPGSKSLRSLEAFNPHSLYRITAPIGEPGGAIVDHQPSTINHQR